jgi:hypothetical protein
MFKPRSTAERTVRAIPEIHCADHAGWPGAAATRRDLLRNSGINDLEKLAELKNKSIITQAEFDTKKIAIGAMKSWEIG